MAVTLADFVALLHGLFALYIIGGCIFVPIGLWRRWPAARSFPFRVSHLFSFLCVVVIELAGQPCPLTVLENQLRRQQAYSGGFIQHYFSALFHLPVAPSMLARLTLPLFLATLGLYIWGGPQRETGVSAATPETAAADGVRARVLRIRLIVEGALLIATVAIYLLARSAQQNAR